MIYFEAKQLFPMARRIAHETTFFFAFYEFIRGIAPIQNLWFRGPGASGGNSLKTRTVVMRANRVGYYRRRPLGGVTPAGPFGLWTGNTRNHTTGRAGRVSVRQWLATVSHDLKRWWVVQWWDVRELEFHLQRVVERRWQTIFDGGQPVNERRAA